MPLPRARPEAVPGPVSYCSALAASCITHCILAKSEDTTFSKSYHFGFVLLFLILASSCTSPLCTGHLADVVEYGRDVFMPMTSTLRAAYCPQGKVEEASTCTTQAGPDALD